MNVPFDADLDRHELRALVDDLAGRPEEWAGRVAFSDEQRHYVSLYRDDHVDVWLLCWTRRNDTGWHDHDISSGAVRVVQGTIQEHNPRIGGDHVMVDVPAGHSFSFGPDHIHRLTGGTDDTVTIHAYSPPLWRMGAFEVLPTGELRRWSLSYAEELRPIGA